MDFYPYWKKKRATNDPIIANNILATIKSKTLQACVNGKRLEKFEEYKRSMGLSESALIKLALDEYFKQQEALSWAEELKDF